MVNPNMNGKTKSPEKSSEKTQNNNNLLKTKRILKPKYTVS